MTKEVKCAHCGKLNPIRKEIKTKTAYFMTCIYCNKPIRANLSSNPHIFSVVKKETRRKNKSAKATRRRYE